MLLCPGRIISVRRRRDSQSSRLFEFQSLPIRLWKDASGRIETSSYNLELSTQNGAHFDHRIFAPVCVPRFGPTFLLPESGHNTAFLNSKATVLGSFTQRITHSWDGK